MPSKNRNPVIGFFLVVTIIVLGFTGLLVISDFQQNFVYSQVSSYEVSGRQVTQKIEYAVRYGKPLENFFGIEDVLREIKAEAPEISDVRITSRDGVVMYNLGGAVRDEYLPEELTGLSDFSDSAGERLSRYDTYDGDYHIFLPIFDRNGVWAGSLQIVFPAEVINDRVYQIIRTLAVYLLIMALAGTLLLALLSRRINFFNKEGKLERKKILITTMLLIGMIQMVFGGINYYTFKNEYLEVANYNASLLSDIIRKDIESVVEKGVPYEKLYQLEDYLAGISENVPEIALISLTSHDGIIHYSTAEDDSIGEEAASVTESSDSTMIYSHELGEDIYENRAGLNLLLSAEYFAQRMRDILFDSLTMIILSLILMIEIVIFMILLLQRRFDNKALIKNSSAQLSSEPQSQPSMSVSVIRTLSLIVGTAVFMSASFIPLRMKELYEPILGLSENITLGLPISMEMLFAALAALMAGQIIDKKGWRFVIFSGTIIFGIGLFLSYSAQSALIFVAARAFSGAGYGLLLLAMRGFVNECPSERERTEGFSSYVSGLYAGFIIGVAIGAMLADRIGFSQVFLVSFFFCIMAGLFTAFFLRRDKGDCSIKENDLPAVGTEAKENSAEKGKTAGALSFLGNSRVFGFFILIMLPLTICSMFVDYFFPVFASGEGLSTSNVGRAFMLNGIAIAYLGPFLSIYTQRRMKVNISIFFSGLIIVAGLILFYIFNNVYMAFMVVILMGISESFGLVAQNNYYINLKATGIFGKGAALGYAENVRKLGQMMGPFVFGGMMAMGALGVGIIGVATMVLLLLFLFLSRLDSPESTP